MQSVNDGPETTVTGDPIVRSATEAGALGMAFQFRVDADGARRFTFVGQRCAAVNGVPAEAVMASPTALFDMIVPEHQPAFAKAEAEAMSAGQPFDVEVAMRRADGEVRWRRVAAIPRPQPDGSVLWDGLQFDVNDRRRLADELLEQRERVEVAVEATDLGLWELEIRTQRLTWSDRNRTIFGVAAADEVTPRFFTHLLHPDDRPKLAEAYRVAADPAGDGGYYAVYRIVTPDGDLRWVESRGRVILDAAGPRLLVGTSLDISERRATDERRTLLLGELAHRAKNGIAIVMSMVSQSARGAETVKEFETRLMARMQAMATSQDLVTASGGRPVDLREVVDTALAPFDRRRFDVDDSLSGVSITGEIAVGLGLMLHEMATNAVKYGALSSDKGRVILARQATPAHRVGFEWREDGGPEVKPTNRSGFGTRLLQQALRTQNGTVTFDFEPQGFRARVECPVAV